MQLVHCVAFLNAALDVNLGHMTPGVMYCIAFRLGPGVCSCMADFRKAFDRVDFGLILLLLLSPLVMFLLQSIKAAGPHLGYRNRSAPPPPQRLDRKPKTTYN